VRELEIVRLRAPGAAERLYAEIVGFVQRMRTVDLFKSPGIAESIDWTNALVALNTISLDPRTSRTRSACCSSTATTSPRCRASK
jgi:MoxR-like ATPase